MGREGITSFNKYWFGYIRNWNLKKLKSVSTILNYFFDFSNIASKHQ